MHFNIMNVSFYEHLTVWSLFTRGLRTTTTTTTTTTAAAAAITTNNNNNGTIFQNRAK